MEQNVDSGGTGRNQDRMQLYARRLLNQLQDHLCISLDQAVSIVNQEFEIDPPTEPMSMQKQTGAVTTGSDDLRVVVQQLQAVRRREADMQQSHDDLVAEQRVARERQEVYALLSKKLRNTLVDERLQHIDTKKQVQELEVKGGSGSEVSRSPVLESDPWGSSTDTSNRFFSSFTRSSQGDELGFHGSGGQFGGLLPSALLDSPQTTPRSGGKSLESLDLATSERCANCESNPVAHCVPCGHSLCSKHEREASNECPRCKQVVSSVRRNAPGDSDQPEAESKVASMQDVSKTVAPITLAVMAEVFDSISVSELETILRNANGKVPAAIDFILNEHPSCNPSKSKDIDLTSGSPTSSLEKAALRQSTSAPSPGSVNWKTELCVYYLQGKCNKTRRTCAFAHGESDLARSSSRSPTSAGYKTRLCPQYMEGTCTKSRRDCPLAHGESDMRESTPVFNPSALLPNATARVQSYKTELCYYYLKGCCNYTKDECRFAHGDDDLRTVESNTLEWSAQISAMASGRPPPPGSGLDKLLQQPQQYQPQQPSQSQPAQQPSSFTPPFHPSQSSPSIQQTPSYSFHPNTFSPHQTTQQQLPFQRSMSQQPYYPTAPPPMQPNFRYQRGMEAPGARPRSSPPPMPPQRNSSSGSWPGYDRSGEF